MIIVTVHAAKTQLSQLLARVEAGEEIVLARGKEPVARLVPFHQRRAKRQFGSLKGMIEVGEDAASPLPQEELEAWEN
jgi:prevent-host-death family protein